MGLLEIFTGGSIKAVGNIVDELYTSEDERNQAKITLEKIHARLKEKLLDINLSEFLLTDIINMIKDSIVPYTKINNNNLKVTIPKNTVKIFSDELKFKQILFNLLTNACKYSHDSDIHLYISYIVNCYIILKNHV